MNRSFVGLLALVSLLSPSGLHGQGVVVDEGTFAITIGGESVGTEEFVIRRPGVGRDDAVFANAVITLRLPEGTREVRSLLRATPPDGVAERYQVTVTGPGAMEVRVARSGRRYSASIRSAMGAEDREYQAHDDTRILEQEIAHHYYFLRNAREGRPVNTLEPRTRLQDVLTAGPAVPETLRLGVNTAEARRIEFSDGSGAVRTVWFDRQGRVLKVEIASLGYLAERTDLVG